jgi:hypothetical protein
MSTAPPRRRGLAGFGTGVVWFCPEGSKMRRITLAVPLVAALAAGCAVAPVSDRAEGTTARTERSTGSHAGSWEVVLPGRNLTAATNGPEAGRLDQALAVRPPETIIDQTLWPPAQAPRVDDLRRRFISDDPRVINYYSAYGRGSAWWYGGWRWR